MNFQQLDTLFRQALELAPDRREAFIDEQCADDPDSANRLRDMLRADHNSHSQFDVLNAAISQQRNDLQQRPQPDCIGPYQVVRELGQGGMGTVYLASRPRDGFDQQVAVKLLHATGAPPVLRERFRLEQEVLAKLRHNAIAGLIDAGTTDLGEPYVVMEYVQGENLTDFARSQSMSLKARLGLFLQLTGAISYAHSNLVVHRDIKPDNVLVDPQGMVKLLDFGIAKLLPGDGEASQLGTLTRAGAMTPPYASPEQVRGQPITIASDIYSLGVVLYELLSGQLPYQVDASASTLELERQICDTNPAPPSQRLTESVSAVYGQRHLRGDLNNIVAKAMQKEPSRRYSSAAQLAEDIQRFLDGQPVSAQKDSFTYRTRKLIARNPLGAVASGILLLSIVAFTAITWRQSLEIEKQRDSAQLEAAAASQVADFMVGLFEVSDPRAGDMPKLSARDLLDRAAADIDSDITDAPLQRARLMHVLGLAYTNLGDYAGGQKLLNQALGLRREFLGNNSQQVAESLNRIGNFHREYGELKAAEAALREALEIRQRITAGPDEGLADSYNNFGLFLREMGNYPDALEMLNRSNEMHQALSGPDSAQLGAPLHNLAQAADALGQYDKAKTLLRRALDIKRRHGKQQQATYANSLAVLAAIELKLGEYESSLKNRSESLATRRAVYSEAHPSLVAGLTGMAATHIRVGQLDIAEGLLDEAEVAAVMVNGPDGTQMARVLTQRGALSMARKRHRAAVAALAQALSIREQKLRPNHPSVASSQLALGKALMAMDELEQAQPLIQAALDQRARTLPENHPHVISASAALAQLANAQGDIETALMLGQRILANPPAESTADSRLDRQNIQAMLDSFSTTTP
ncbi:MAG: tetratricopeptide repeat protein [Lysobacterales bacterium]